MSTVLRNRLTAIEKLHLLHKALSGEQIIRVAKQAGVSPKTLYRWLKRYKTVSDGARLEALEDHYRRGQEHWNKIPKNLENQVIKLSLSHPEWGSLRIAGAIGNDEAGNGRVSSHGVYRILRSHGLSQEEERKDHIERNGERLVHYPTFDDKKSMMQAAEGGEGKASICRRLGISRTTFYKWYRQWATSSQEKKDAALNQGWVSGEDHWRFVPGVRKAILDIVQEHPLINLDEITALVPKDEEGKPLLGRSGIYRYLYQRGLNSIESRRAWARREEKTSEAIAINPATGWKERISQVSDQFLPSLAPAPPPPGLRPSGLAAPFFKNLQRLSTIILLSIFIIFGFYEWGQLLGSAESLIQSLGWLFASGALLMGSVFFIYSLKYYFTLAVVLSFSREARDDTQDSLQFGRANGRAGGQAKLKTSFQSSVFRSPTDWLGPSQTWLTKLFGIGPSKLSFEEKKAQLFSSSPGGLEPDLTNITLERRPFISVHLPMYNEKQVAERILRACTSFDYIASGGQALYEVVVADDSTDETTAIVERFAQQWNSKHNTQNSTPFIKMIHRDTREGFKGGALKEALKHTDPRAEFIVVFDADFVPYPDTLELFLKYFQVNSGSLDFRLSSLANDQRPTTNVAAIQGYQWHVLNKSENWITRGVRSEYAGSYVIERSGAELYGGLKQIAGSVYMIRKDLLDRFGWGTSITEDFQLTLKLYEAGYKVVYTPYIQAPAECASTLKRLIRQRMRWAEGHSFNVRRMFTRLLFGGWRDGTGESSRVDNEVRRMNYGLNSHDSSFMIHDSKDFQKQGRVWRSSPLSLSEKLEFLYLSPYYLQAAFFLLGTICWLFSETLFKARLPFWTTIWGWSLVLTNLLSLPLMNAVGLFLEESEEKDFAGIFSFIFLTYLLTPFQAYASARGFLEIQEGPWFRTPKTGKITDILTRGRFYRFVRGIFSRQFIGSGMELGKERSPQPAWAWLPSQRPFRGIPIHRRQARWLTQGVLIFLTTTSVLLSSFAFLVTPIQASPDTFYFRNLASDYLAHSADDGTREMNTTLGSSTTTQTLNGAGDTFYILTDNMNKKWTADRTLTTSTTGERRNIDVATDSSGNTVAVWEDTRNSNSVNDSFAATSDNMTVVRSSHADSLLTNGMVLIAGGVSGSTWFSTAEYYDPVTDDFTASTGNMNVLRSDQTANSLANGKVLIAGGRSASTTTLSTAELFDPQTGTFALTSGNMTVQRANHTAVLLADGQVLLVGGRRYSVDWITLLSATRFNPLSGTFADTAGNMSSARRGHTATLLANGTVMIAGGVDDAPTYFSTAELFNPTTGTFSLTTGNMQFQHASHTATLLNSGKVLIAGGGPGTALSIAELYDPSTGTFSQTAGNMNSRRQNHAATLLNNGKVLIAGGSFSATYLSTAELYDPDTETFTQTTGNMTYERTNSTSLLLNSGRVLLAGGSNGSALSTAELYTPRTSDIYAQKYNYSGTSQWGGGTDIKVNSDSGNRTTQSGNPSNYDHLNPRVKLDSSGNAIVAWQEARNSVYGDDIYSQKLQSSDGAKLWPNTSANTNKFASTGNLIGRRDTFASTLLIDGKVLVAGGYDGSTVVSTAELYDPTAGSFSSTGNLIGRRYEHTMTLLTNGKVLVTGGFGASIPLSTAELYDPRIASFSSTGNLIGLRYRHTATLLSNGKVLIAAGYTGTAALSTAELYDPTAGSFSSTGNLIGRRFYHTATLLPDGKVLFTGGTSTGSTHLSTAELYDPTTGVFSSTGGYMTGIRTRHSALLLVNGKVLVAGGVGVSVLSSAELFDPSTGSFSSTGNLIGERYQFIAALLNNGKVLVAGGFGTISDVSTAELFDPSIGTWSSTGNLIGTRYQHSSALLNDGRILVAGGRDNAANRFSTAELYTPASDIAVSNDGSPMNGSGLPVPEYPDRKGILGEQTNPVLAIDSSDNAIIAWEDSRFAAIRNWGLSFNYDSNAWWQTNANLGAAGACNGGGGTNNSCGALPAIAGPPLRIMGQKLSSSTGAKNWGDDQAAVNQNNPEDIGLSSTGDINRNPSLAIDGTNVILTWDSNSATKAESGTMKREGNIYSQKLNSNGAPQWGGTFSTTGNMSKRRAEHATTLLPNGKVLVTGGYDFTNRLSTAEVYDPSVGTFSATGNMTSRRDGHISILLQFGSVLLAGGSDGTNFVSTAELYNSSAGTFSVTDNMTTARRYHAASLLANGNVLITGGIGIGGVKLSTAELYNPSSGTFSATGNMASLRTNQTSTLLTNGKVLVAGGIATAYSSSAELFDPTAGTFSVTGNMTSARASHTATLLTSGRVLMTGGEYSAGSSHSTAEIYDPLTGTFSVTGNMSSMRRAQSGILLPNGNVLVAGGKSGSDDLSSAEIYNPTSGSFSATAYMVSRHNYHTSILLSDGKVLIVGGYASSSISNAELYSIDQIVNSGVDLAEQETPSVAINGSGTSAELFYSWAGVRGSGMGGGRVNQGSDKRGGTWAIYGQELTNPASGSPVTQWPSGTSNVFTNTTGRMNQTRVDFPATVLMDGRVLVTGGESANTIAELFSPSANTFSSTTGGMRISRFQHTATLLPNGKVLIAGGNDPAVTSAELYDPASQTFSYTTGGMVVGRLQHTATLLKDGRVLVTGGNNPSGTTVTAAELYTPSTNTFAVTTGGMTTTRRLHTTTLLPDGKVLLIGGCNGAGCTDLSSSELFNPSTNTFTASGNMITGRRLHIATLLDNGQVLVAGHGTTVAELFDPGSGSFSQTSGGLQVSTDNGPAVLLPSGKVIIIGGDTATSRAELYDPTSQSFSYTTGGMNTARRSHAAVLMPDGRILVSGGYSTDFLSTAELYTPAGEMLVSHSSGLGGHQTSPKVTANSGNPIVVWQDTRSFVGTTLTSDQNVFMQKLSGSSGRPQWPAATTGGSYSAPYAVTDIRVDSLAGGTGTHYSGKPAVGGVTGSLADGTIRVYLGYEDNRNDAGAASGECGVSNSTSLVRVCGQSYDVNEININQSSSWTVYFYASAAAGLTVNTDIMEWDGTQIAKASANSTWSSCSPACPSMQTVTFTSGGSPAPPSDTTGNISMRRLQVRFTWSSGTVTISYDNSGFDSRLATGTIVPENSLILGLVIPVLPPMVGYWRRRRSPPSHRRIRAIGVFRRFANRILWRMTHAVQ